MKQRIIFSLVAIFLLCSFGFSKRKTTIFIAGDSTAQTYVEKRDGLIKGWGQMLPQFLDDDITVCNHAKGGRSTKSFIDEGRWDSLMSQVEAGDFVLIQFGHNDASTKPERHASYEDYRKNLTRFINDVRAKKATPILLTSIVMRTFVKGNLTDDRLKGYPVIMRQLAREMNVPLVDVNLMTHDFVTMLGDSASIPYYRHVKPGEDPTKPDGLSDDTHMMTKGATQVAKFVAEGLQELNIKELSKHIALH